MKKRSKFHITDLSLKKLTYKTAKELIRVLNVPVSQGKTIILNMQEVEDFDLGGMRALVRLYQTARRQGGALVLTNLAPEARMILTIVKLHQVIPTYTDIEEAKRALENLPLQIAV